MKLLYTEFLGLKIESWDPVLAAILITLAIIAILKIIGALRSRSADTDEKASQAVTSTTVSAKPKLSADEEIVAVISAAVAAFSEQDGKNYSIKSITPVRRQKTQTARSAWANAGIFENTRQF